MATEASTLIVQFPSRFCEFAEAALLKLQVRHPDLLFLIKESSVEVSAQGIQQSAQLRREILHAIYAEKIFAETLTMRRSLLAAVTAR